MAVPEPDEEEKATVRCLDVVRYVVAGTVTALIVAVIVCAATGALRPPEIALWAVDKGYVWVSLNASLDRDYHSLRFKYTVRVMNPSHHNRVYLADIIAKLKARNSSGDENSFLVLHVSDIALPPQRTLDITLELATVSKSPFQVEYFKALGDGRDINDAWMVFSGTRIVEGQNMTRKASVVYYCSPVVVSTRIDEIYSTAPPDTLCTESQPMAVS